MILLSWADANESICSRLAAVAGSQRCLRCASQSFFSQRSATTGVVGQIPAIEVDGKEHARIRTWQEPVLRVLTSCVCHSETNRRSGKGKGGEAGGSQRRTFFRLDPRPRVP